MKGVNEFRVKFPPFKLKRDLNTKIGVYIFL